MTLCLSSCILAGRGAVATQGGGGERGRGLEPYASGAQGKQAGEGGWLLAKVACLLLLRKGSDAASHVQLALWLCLVSVSANHGPSPCSPSTATPTTHQPLLCLGALQGYVRLAVDQFLAGTDLYRLQLQQSMAGDCAGEGDAAGVSPAVRMLQLNTRLGEPSAALPLCRDAGAGL